MSAPPIRVGLIGLSTSDPNSWARTAHLPYLLASPRYTITAVCNSSLAASTHAIALYNLPATTTPFATPAALARSPTVDLVVCCVRVDAHAAAITPALRAAKAVFVEWPLASSLPDAQLLQQLAQAQRVRTVIGLQGRLHPAVPAVRGVLDAGRLGRVASSAMAASGYLELATCTERSARFNERAVGGSLVEILGGHLSDVVCAVLGEYAEVSARLTTQCPEVRVMAADGTVVREVTRTSADHVAFMGQMRSGVSSSVLLRQGPTFAGDNGLEWSIVGERGCLRVTAKSPVAFNFGGDVHVRLFVFETGEVLDIWRATNQVEDDLRGLEAIPAPAKAVARLYEAYAEGVGYQGWTQALRRHKLIDALHKSSESGRSVTLA